MITRSGCSNNIARADGLAFADVHTAQVGKKGAVSVPVSDSDKTTKILMFSGLRDATICRRHDLLPGLGTVVDTIVVCAEAPGNFALLDGLSVRKRKQVLPERFLSFIFGRTTTPLADLPKR